MKSNTKKKPAGSKSAQKESLEKPLPKPVIVKYKPGAELIEQIQ